MEYCQHQPIHKTCTANHRISKNSSLRPFFASHMKMSKILVRTVISRRLTLEFIFICQNANVNAERTFVSRGKGGGSINVLFFFSALLPFHFLFCLGASYFDMIMHSHSSIQIYCCPPSPAKPHLFSLCVCLCVCLCVLFLAFLSKCFSEQVQ